MADFTYTCTGMFTAFYPENDGAVEAWKQLAEVTNDTGKVMNCQKDEVITALRNAGYTVSKAKTKSMTEALDDLLELDGLFK